MTTALNPAMLVLAQQALEEDAVGRDVTTSSLEEFLKSRGDALPAAMPFEIRAKQGGVFSGGEWAAAVAAHMGLVVDSCMSEGATFGSGDVVCAGKGSPSAVLSAERTLLNGLQIACGAATSTRQYVEIVRRTWDEKKLSGAAPSVYHTRKIPPALRELLLKGVDAGGGQRHRRDLSDRILFKENHKFFLQKNTHELQDYVAYLVTWGYEDFIVEVETLAEAQACVEAGAPHLLLDNFTPDLVREFLASTRFSGEVEVSGGLSKESLPSYCIPGVTRFSVGSLTRDVKGIDLSLDWGQT